MKLEDYPIYDGEEHPGQWLAGINEIQIQGNATLAFAWTHLSPRIQACLTALQELLRQMNTGHWDWSFSRLSAALTRMFGTH